jgi:hypothetical protein
VIRLVCVAQGLYYLITGLWPLISMETFLAITGPKTDLWLVDTVAVLVTVIGSVLLFAAARHQITSAIWLLAIGSAAALTIVESFYALRGVIWSVYLLDAVLEVGLIALWVIALVRSRHTITSGVRHQPHPVR